MEILIYILAFALLAIMTVAVTKFRKRRIDAAEVGPDLEHSSDIELKLEGLAKLQEYYVASAALAAAALTQWMSSEVEKVLIENGEKIELTLDPLQAKTQYFICRAREQEALILFQLGANGIALPVLQKKDKADAEKAGAKAPVEESPENSPDPTVPKPPKGNLPN